MSGGEGEEGWGKQGGRRKEMAGRGGWEAKEELRVGRVNWTLVTSQAADGTRPEPLPPPGD